MKLSKRFGLHLQLLVLATIVLCAHMSLARADVALQRVLQGLSSPLYVTNAHDGTQRLFVVQQPGQILVLPPGASTPTLFLDISSKVVFGGEQGLLGLAFHPHFAANSRFFVDYTRASDGATVIAEYHASQDPNATAASEAVLLVIPQPYANHNGGMLEFGPDGYLYIGMGDGGSANDPENRAQNINELLGKILRIDVDHPANGLPYSSPPGNPYAGATPGRDEIFAIGMRNPFRFSFDRQTGQLYVGDVGQAAIEEIDIVTVGGNYGWRVYEGTQCTNLDPQLCNPANFVAPIAQYTHASGRCSIIGGYVYRGAAGAFAAGAYIFGDLCTGEIFTLQGSAPTVLVDTTLSISSFGEDESGELYVVGLGGSVDRLVPVGQGTTTTTLASSANPANVGTDVIFTATVRGTAPTGSVSFSADGSPITSPNCTAVTLSGGRDNPTATCTTTSLTVGTHNIVASYGGDGGNAPSQSVALSQAINDVSPNGTNVALQANGGVASASSTYNASGFTASPAGANNGDRKGLNWNSGGIWHDATPNTFPDWLQISFNGSKTISEIDVFAVQDNYPAPIEPTPTMTFDPNGLTGLVDFEVQYLSGGNWVDVPGGHISGNNLVWRRLTFAAISTTAIRVQVNAGLNSYSRIAEVEAWSTGGTSLAATNTTLASSANPATVGSGVTLTATVSTTVSGSNPTGSVTFTEGGNVLSGCPTAVALTGSGDSKTAVCSTSTLGVGTHNIVASYGGDAANAGSSSAVLAQGITDVTSGTNVALQANGGVASASSTYNANGFTASPAGANNGDRKGLNWNSGGIWHDATPNAFPDWLQVSFNGSKTISEVDVFAVQDNYPAPIEPTPTMTFDPNGLTGLVDFEVQYLSGGNWVDVPGGHISNNNLVWRKLSFTPITTTAIRVLVNAGLNSYSRIAEVEAWSTGGTSLAATNTTLASSANPATVGSGVTLTATVSTTVSGSNPTGSVTFTEGGNVLSGCPTAVALTGSGDSKTAVCSTSTLGVGTHNIVASYGGDAANAGSSSAVVAQGITGINVALQANGGVASASSTYNANGFTASPAGANNGDRKGLNWNSGGIWHDATPNAFPDWLQVSFNGSKTISEVDVFAVQDNYQAPIEPTPTMTFDPNGLTGLVDFEVQYLSGGNWVDVPGGHISNNNLVWRKLSFTPITTTAIRVLVNAGLNSYSRIAEVEAWSAGP